MDVVSDMEESDMNSSLVLLRAVAVSKTYRLPHKEVVVLQGASFEARRGERVAIIGRSGAGKSTLLHVLGGLDRPDGGEVFLGDASLYALGQRRRTALRADKVGFVFQAYHLLPEMSVEENVLLPAMAITRTPRRELRARAMELLEQVGLADRATHMPMELSGGEQQRVAIARALMNSPELILADEPTGNLDSQTGERILDLLFGLVRRRGHTLVVVTHDESVAARCDRRLLLDEGVMRPAGG